MKVYVVMLLCISNLVCAQRMNNQQLFEILSRHADTITGFSGNWQFTYEHTAMLCITDSINNRMRIMSPITKVILLDKDLLLDALTANFHSALDVRYAIAHEILWVAYIHPLKELMPYQIEDAISQVYHAHRTFGSTFSSTPLLFATKPIGKKRQNNSTKEETPIDTFPKF